MLNSLGKGKPLEPPFLISLIFVQFKTNSEKCLYYYNWFKFFLGTVSSREKLVKMPIWGDEDLKWSKRENRKEPTCHSQCNSIFNRTLFFILENLVFKKHNLVKSDEIKHACIKLDRLAIKCNKLWKRQKPAEINRRLILWQVNKFHEHCGFEKL